MKNALFALLLFALLFCFIACDNGESAAGGGVSEITGNIAYFYGYEEFAIDVFYSESTDVKEITLQRNKTYKIGFRPSFRGSKSAVYVGDVAKFTFPDGCCDVSYVGDEENHPIYELIITGTNDFDLTVEIDGYVQTISIKVLYGGFK